MLQQMTNPTMALVFIWKQLIKSVSCTLTLQCLCSPGATGRALWPPLEKRLWSCLESTACPSGGTSPRAPTTTGLPGSVLWGLHTGKQDRFRRAKSAGKRIGWIVSWRNLKANLPRVIFSAIKKPYLNKSLSKTKRILNAFHSLSQELQVAYGSWDCLSFISTSSGPRVPFQNTAPPTPPHLRISWKHSQSQGPHAKSVLSEWRWWFHWMTMRSICF